MALTIAALAAQPILAQEESSPPTAAMQRVGPTASARDCPGLAALPCRRKLRTPAAVNVDFRGSGGALHVQGTVAAVQLEVHQSTMRDVLAALAAAFNIHIRGPDVLDQVVDGSYRGSLDGVLARLLEGHNFVIKRETSGLDVIVFGSGGERPIVAAAVPRRVRDRRCRARLSAQMREAMTANAISPCP